MVSKHAEDFYECTLFADENTRIYTNLHILNKKGTWYIFMIVLQIYTKYTTKYTTKLNTQYATNYDMG